MTRHMTDWLRQTPIAHRGLHNQREAIIENSISAFRAAVEAGYAIELDLQVSSDGEAVVFHDLSLERLTSQRDAVSDRKARDLSKTRLRGSDDCIPLLAEVLDLVVGRVPLLIELKAWTRQIGRLEERTATLLRDYKGPFAVQSFNPFCIRWFRDFAPEIPRGLLSTHYRETYGYELSRRARFMLRHLLMAPMLRPDFIAYDVNALPAMAPSIARRLGLPVLAWTVANEHQMKVGSAYADNIIFEGFRAPFPKGA